MPYLSPPTLTAAEQLALLTASAGHPRDHLIFSVALGTGLRLGEIAGLNVGDVFLPDPLAARLARLWGYKAARRKNLEPSAPLFCNLGRRRISRRRVQVVFRAWQVVRFRRAGVFQAAWWLLHESSQKSICRLRPISSSE